MAAIALALAGCETTPKSPGGPRPSVEVGAPLKSEAWKSLATAADKDRLARLGLAWQEALDDAKRNNAADVNREGGLLLPRSALPRPDLHAWQLQLPPDQARQGFAQGGCLRNTSSRSSATSRSRIIC